MTAAWPATLPQFVQEQGFDETLPNQRLESSVDSGPPKARRRFTKNYRAIQCEIWCDADQADDFEDFYETDLAGGVLPFTWVNPVTQTAATFRFRGSPPRRSVRGEIVIYRLQMWQL